MDDTSPISPNHRHRGSWITFPRVVIAVIVVGLLAVLGGVVDNTRHINGLNKDVKLAREQRDALVEQVERLGEKPVVDVPPGERGPAGEQGIQGPPGPPPSASQVQNAVSRYCQINDCRGPRGLRPTAVQVAAAVASYCDDRGQCQGPVGATGAPGAEGPGPTDDQIAAAVNDYCAAHDGCAGPKGETGVGVSNVQVREDCHLWVTLTDGTEIDAGQVCTLHPPVDLTPTATPS